VDAFGTIVSPPMVEREVLRVLEAWSADYIAAVSGQARGDRAQLDDIAAWERVGRFPTELPERQLPYVAIVSTGTVDAPTSDGEALSFRLAFNLGVIAAAGGENAEEDARDLAADYGTALTVALVHKGVTSPLIASVLPRGIQLGERPPIADLSVAAAVSVLWVDVDDAMPLYGGPETPSADPVPAPPALSQVETITLTINAEDST
jgi:hypothetical protein